MRKDFEDVADYLDQVKLNCEIRFENDLAPLLGVSTRYLSQLRHGRTVPSPPLMIKLANLAFADVEEALILRSYLAAKTPEEKFIWLRAKKKLSRNGLSSVILALAFSFHFSSAKFDLPLSNSFDECSDINCAINIPVLSGAVPAHGRAAIFRRRHRQQLKIIACKRGSQQCL